MFFTAADHHWSRRAVGVGAVLLVLGACASPGDDGMGAGAAPRPAAGGSASSLPEGERVPLDRLPVYMLTYIADVVGQDLAALKDLAGPGRRAVVALGPFDNRSTLPLDPRLVLETIRASAIDQSGGSLLFRDDRVYGDILEERKREAAKAKAGRRASGGARGRSGKEPARSMETTHILTGSLFQMRDHSPDDKSRTLTYFQFHFRLVDRGSGVIVWHRSFDSQVLGQLSPTKPTATTGSSTDGGFLHRIPF